MLDECIEWQVKYGYQKFHEILINIGFGGRASRLWVNFSISQLWIDAWESGVESTTAHGSHT